MKKIKKLLAHLRYVKNLERAYKEEKERSIHLGSVLQDVRSQLYDKERKDTYLTIAIDTVIKSNHGK
jgi:hypothetical protein